MSAHLRLPASEVDQTGAHGFCLQVIERKSIDVTVDSSAISWFLVNWLNGQKVLMVEALPPFVAVLAVIAWLAAVAFGVCVFIVGVILGLVCGQVSASRAAPRGKGQLYLT